MKLAVTLLVFCVAALLALGMVALYSCAGSRYLAMQLSFCAVSLVLAVVACLLDYRQLKKIVWPLWGLALVLLVLVLIPHIGIKVNGARRWIGYGAARFQCSEFAKLALIVVLAWYAERYQRQMPTWKRGILIPALFIAPILGLIFIEPDRGTTILLAAVSLTMLLVAGVRWRYVIPPAVGAVAVLAYSLWHDSMRRGRIFSWLHLEENKSGVGYQAWEAMLALGSGGWTGLGLGNSRQKLGFVPEHHTDFILSMIGEELGVVATLLIVVAFVVIVVCGLYIAVNSSDNFGLLLGSGITFLIGMQAFINIGVVTSALPNKGLPLPFISYGGSNLMMMVCSVGLLLSIARRARAPEIVSSRGEKNEANPFRGSARAVPT